jgi:hypothetical protein
VRDLAVAKPVDVGELDYAPLVVGQALDGEAQPAAIGARLGRDRHRLQRGHARLEAAIARPLALRRHRQVAQDSAQPGARVRPGAIAMAGGDGAGEGLLHQILGLAW